MEENDNDPAVINSAELLLPMSGEAVGTAEREYRPEKLREWLVSSSMFRQLVEKGEASKTSSDTMNSMKNTEHCTGDAA
jgi:hypothetical protein